MGRARVIRYKIEKVPDTDMGTLTLSQRFCSWQNGSAIENGTTVKIGKVMSSPVGIRYYKVFEANIWLSDHQVCNVKVKDVPSVRSVKIYSI